MALRDNLTYETLCELHINQNLSLTAIGNKYNVSRQRIHQLKKEFEKEYGKISRQVYIDPVTLNHYLDQGWTAKMIADYFDIKPNQITRLIRKYQIEYEEGLSPINVKRKKTEDLLPKHLLMEHYLEDLMTDKEIGDLYRISSSSVNLLRKKYNIKTINTKSLRKLPIELPKEKFHHLYNIKGQTLNQIATTYQCHVISLIHLKKKYNLTKK